MLAARLPRLATQGKVNCVLLVLPREPSRAKRQVHTLGTGARTSDMTNTQVQQRERQEGDNAFAAHTPQTALGAQLEDARPLARTTKSLAHFAYLLLIELSGRARPPWQINAPLALTDNAHIHTQEKRRPLLSILALSSMQIPGAKLFCAAAAVVSPQEETRESESFFQSNLPGLQRATE